MTFPATDGITDRLQALFAYDASSPLIFSSGLFLFLFAGFLLVYSVFRRAPMARIVYVIAFSLYFYYKSSGIYFLLLVFAAASDFLIARGIYRARFRWTKRWLVVLSVAVNLGMLGYFKYTNFLIDISNQLFGQGFLQFQNIFLPVGISFFVFQSMSYTIDIYRGQLKPLSNWLDYLFYLSFFPQLVAGPIVRARDFIPQIRQNPVVVTREMFGTGVFLILTGLFKKAIISDYISLNFVDRIFDEPLLYSGFECLMGIYGYALQIYCDFSGYSDMAIGIALLLGFRFPKNFDAPYKSATITEFWRRWHISLSTWLRDYLYISLGGNRKGRIRTYGNLLLTMLLGGLWHGAAVRFILWGGLHGAALALHKLWMALVPGAKATGAQMHWWSRAAGMLPDVQHRLPGVADVPRRVDADRLADAAPDFRKLQRRDDPAGRDGLRRRLRADRRGLHPAPAAVGRRRRRAADRGPCAAGSAGPDGRGDDLVRHADQIQRHTAVYLFPVLIRIWTRSCIPECRFRRLQRRLQIGPTPKPSPCRGLVARDRIVGQTFTQLLAYELRP